MVEDQGVTARSQGEPGSREPDQQAVPALTGFDPSREDVTVMRLVGQLGFTRELLWAEIQRSNRCDEVRCVYWNENCDCFMRYASLIASDPTSPPIPDALAIEARSDETRSGSAEGESAGRQATPIQGTYNGQ